MRTFQEFISLAERYYKPDEKLPSGKTPVEKATEKSRKRAKTVGSESPKNQERWGRQYDLTQTKVKHGADNPKINARVSHKDKDDLKIDSDDNSTDIYHKPSGVYYTIYRSTGTDMPYSRTIEWNHDKDRNNMSREQGIKVAQDARRVWDQHVSHRLPYSSIVHNTPASSYDSRGREKPVNRRSSIYQRSGFGRLDDEGDQFAEVGREPSPKQKAKGKKRLEPRSPHITKSELDWE